MTEAIGVIVAVIVAGVLTFAIRAGLQHWHEAGEFADQLAEFENPQDYQPCRRPGDHGPRLASASVSCPDPEHWETRAMPSDLLLYRTRGRHRRPREPKS